MADIKRRIEKLEARLKLEQGRPSFEDDCAACSWYADALEALDGGGELAPRDKAIWDDIFTNGIDSTKAWKKWQTTNDVLTV